MTPTHAAPAHPVLWPALTAGGALFHGTVVMSSLTSATTWAITCALEGIAIAAAHFHGRNDAQKQLLVDALANDPLEPQPQLAGIFRAGPADGRTGWLTAATIVAPLQGATYLTSWHATRNRVDVPAVARALVDRAPTTSAPKAPAKTSAPAELYEYDPENLRPLPQPRAGAIIGWNASGALVRTNPRTSTLIIGPPGQGKTQGVICPCLVAAPGPVISTSIKNDVLTDTLDDRRALGNVWVFDPSGRTQSIEGTTAAHWSPFNAVYDWESAQSVSEAMASAIQEPGSKEGNKHFLDSAASWLSVLLYAASHEGIDALLKWVRRPADDATVTAVRAALSQSGDTEAAEIAGDTLDGLLSTGPNERGSILSTLKRLVALYSTTGGLRIARDANFSPRKFVRSHADSLYIVVPQQHVGLYSHITAALLTEIYNARTDLHDESVQAGTTRPVPLTMVLDEVANTARVPLPRWVSQAGGQGIHLVAAIQDLSQARSLYGADDGAGLLTMQGDKVILPGILDDGTTGSISRAAGQFDQTTISESFSETGGKTQSLSTRQLDRIPQSRIAQLADGELLHVSGARPQFLAALKWWQPTERDRIRAAIQVGA